jgi:hypothetical protein
MEPLLLKAGDVAKLFGLGRSKVFAMLAAGSCRLSGLDDRCGCRARPSNAGLPSTHRTRTAEAGMPVPSSLAWRIGMLSLVPAPAPSREMCPESRCWALAGCRARRRLERRPEKRRPFERGSNVDFSRKCSSIFLISNRPAGLITGPD